MKILNWYSNLFLHLIHFFKEQPCIYFYQRRPLYLKPENLKLFYSYSFMIIVQFGLQTENIFIFPENVFRVLFSLLFNLEWGWYDSLHTHGCSLGFIQVSAFILPSVSSFGFHCSIVSGFMKALMVEHPVANACID